MSQGKNQQYFYFSLFVNHLFSYLRLLFQGHQNGQGSKKRKKKKNESKKLASEEKTNFPEKQ